MVVEVVVEKVIGTDVNFAIPISIVKAFLNKPELTVEEREIGFVFRHQSIDLKFHVVSFGTAIEKYRVELELRNSVGEKSEMVVDKPDSEGKYSFNAIPVKPVTTRMRIPVKVVFKSGTVTGEMTEQEIRFGNSIHYLVEMKLIEKTNDQRQLAEFIDAGYKNVYSPPDPISRFVRISGR